MSKVKALHGALDDISEALRLADDEVSSVIKIKHPKRYSMDEYEERISKK